MVGQGEEIKVTEVSPVVSEKSSEVSEAPSTSTVTTTEEGVKRKRSSDAFPKFSLKNTLAVAQSIEDNHAGEPYNYLDLSESLGKSPQSSSMRMLVSNSYRFGLTTGSYCAEKIALTELGKSIVAPRSDKEKMDGIAAALLNFNLFKEFIKVYDQKKLPADNLLRNILIRDFSIPATDADACLASIKQNFEDWGLIVDYGGSKWLRLDKLTPNKPDATVSQDESTQTPEPQKITDQMKPSDAPKSAEKIESEPVAETPQLYTPIVPRVFISHSKNKEILDQIKAILKFGRFDYVVAEEIETTSIPIPEKIFKLMKECNCAIINISADECEKDAVDKYHVNGNVLIEIGGAFLLYGHKVILLTDKRVEKLPSNLQGLYRCEYEGDELSGKTTLKIQEALTRFRDDS